MAAIGYDRYGTWQYTGVMTSRAFSVVSTPSMFTVSCSIQRGSNRFEYYTEVNILSITDSSWIPPGGWYAFQSVRCCLKKTSFCSEPFIFQSLESFSIFECFGGIDTGMALPKAACSLPNTGCPNPMGHPLMTQVSVPPMVSPFAFTLYKVCHFLRLFQVRTTYIVCFDQVEDHGPE